MPKLVKEHLAGVPGGGGRRGTTPCIIGSRAPTFPLPDHPASSHAAGAGECTRGQNRIAVPKYRIKIYVRLNLQLTVDPTCTYRYLILLQKCNTTIYHTCRWPKFITAVHVYTAVAALGQQQPGPAAATIAPMPHKATLGGEAVYARRLSYRGRNTSLTCTCIVLYGLVYYYFIFLLLRPHKY
eukprot:SAG31_NODE_3117_length_4657_cov_12.864634_2_plen_183_part_00